MRRGEGGRGKRERRVLYQHQTVLDVLEDTKIQTRREEILSVLGMPFGYHVWSEQNLRFGNGIIFQDLEDAGHGCD